MLCTIGFDTKIVTSFDLRQFFIATIRAEENSYLRSAVSKDGSKNGNGEEAQHSKQSKKACCKKINMLQIYK